MVDTAKFEGGCLCGAVRYRAIAAPIRAVICHCSMCRKHSGAPVLAFVHFPIDFLHLDQGTTDTIPIIEICGTRLLLEVWKHAYHA